MLSKELGSWWIGTIQSVSVAEKLCPGQSPTTLLVTAGVMASVIYAFRHPNLGVIHPEEMDEEETMDMILPYLYPFVSYYVEDWEPHVQSKFKSSKDFKNKIKRTEDWTIDKFLL